MKQLQRVIVENESLKVGESSRLWRQRFKEVIREVQEEKISKVDKESWRDCTDPTKEGISIGSN